MTKDNTFNDSVWLYENSYGSALKIKRSWLIGFSSLILLCTIGTNWIIPLLPKIIKKDIIVRYE
jgi:hypothetical protein